jgi:hypothetical protein
MHALSGELGLEIPDDIKQELGDMLGPVYGDHQFYEIIQFMTGHWAPSCPAEEKDRPGKERCLALIYCGVDAVNIIRGILGPTDPSKARPGSVRREFGQDIMVNAAHASDSTENAKREMDIIKVQEDTVANWIEKYYGEDG